MIGLWIQWIAFLLVTGLGLFLFWQAVYHRILYMRLGRPEEHQPGFQERFEAFAKQVFGHSKLLKDRRSGLMHAVMFYGFIVLQFGALDLIVKGLGGERLPLPGYPVFTLIQEITTALVLAAAAYAAYRRYGEKLSRLKRGWKPGIVLVFIVSLMLSVLLTLAFERLRDGLAFSAFAPLSSAIAALFTVLFTRIPPLAAETGFYVAWWAHLVLLLAFLVYVPQSKHFHFPDTIARVVNPETGEELPPGEIGELTIEGPQVMLGYWNRPEETANTLKNGVLYTGDMAKMDEDGFFYIIDRKKDMIIASGFNIYPREIEEVLYAHPAVQDAAVAGIPDPYRGETVKAYIVLKAGASLTEQELDRYCREHLAAYKVPRVFEFRQELPKSMVGKILRRKLIEEELDNRKNKGSQ